MNAHVTVPADEQAELPGLVPKPSPPASNADDSESFNWFEDPTVIVERQVSIAVYRNGREHVVIRGEGEIDDEDRFIILATDDAIRALIAALQRELKRGGR